jgi:hypothetical protein
VGCKTCPRAYHTDCADISTAGHTDVENWACPACALLGLDEPQDIPSASSNVGAELRRSNSVENDEFKAGEIRVDSFGRVSTSRKRPYLSHSNTGKSPLRLQ